MGRKSKDLTGQKFGKLLVLHRSDDYVEPNGKHRVQWLCQCECGNVVEIRSDNLINNSTNSCGCIKHNTFQGNDLTGQTFGYLTVIKRVDDYISPKGIHKLRWKCRCKCGKEVNVNGTNLKSGGIKSCGCAKLEVPQCMRKDLKGLKFGKLTVLYETPTKWHCICDCGNECDVSTSQLTTGKTKSCGCMKSGGELTVIEFLNQNKIAFESQKRFADLLGVGNKKLSYDFYIPDMNILIECQGLQHIYPIEYFGGEEQFKIQKEHDKRKREYAEKNGYKLLEIWYYDYDKIEEILSRELELN